MREFIRLRAAHLRAAALLLTLGVAAWLQGPGAALAASATGSFQVSATVTKNCKVSASSLSFGSSYVPGGGDANTTSVISVNCTKGTPFTVALGAGASTGSTVSNRNMTGGSNPTDLLSYQLYTDAGRTTIWGDGTGGTSTSASQNGQGMASSQVVALTVYGQIPDSASNQAAPPDSYSDTVQVTVTY